jgi:hypothetical protein
MRNRMVNSETSGEQQSLRAARRFAPSIKSTYLFAALCATLCAVWCGGTVKAYAADAITWTPYAGTPNGNATFLAYPGAQSADNTIILTVTGPDILQGTEFGQHLSITGANAAQFQEDTSVLPSCATSIGDGSGVAPPYTCALAMYFLAPSTPGTYTATLTFNYVDPSSTGAGSQSITLTGTVLPVPTPSGNASLAFLPVMTTFAGTGGVGYSGNNGPAIDAELNSPSDVAVDSQGNVFIADTDNYVVRKVDTTGKITVYAGTPLEGGYGSGYTGEGGPATSATLIGPVALAVDHAGNLYIADSLYAVRVVNAVTGAITTYAGSQFFEYGYSGDGGLATSALLYAPSSLAVDPNGNLYIAEINTNDIRMVNTSGMISTYAGQSTYYNQTRGYEPNFQGFSGDGGPASSATLYRPYYLAIDTIVNPVAGNISSLYIADGENDRVRAVNLVTGIIETVAGLGAFSTGAPASLGATDLPAATAEIYPLAVAIDPAGNYYVINYDGLLFMTNSATGLMTQFPSASTTTLFSGGGSTAGMKIANSGTMYIASQSLDTVTAISAQGILNFGSVDVGDTSNPKFLTIQNNGSGPLAFNGTPYVVVGNFGVVDTGTCSFGAILAVGASCTVAVNFSPQVPGPLTGAISFASNDPNSPLVAQLSGIGVGLPPPVAVLSPTTLIFPATTVGGLSTLSTQLSNTGGSLLIISDILPLLDPADFAIDPSTTCLSTLAAGVSCTITVDFRPAAGVSYSSVLSVVDNAAGSPQSATLTGTGVLAVVNLPINETIHVTDTPDLTPAASLIVAETIHVTDVEPGLAPPSLILPMPGLSTILGTSNVSFQWTPDSAVKKFQLLLGTGGAGTSNLYKSGQLTSLSAIVTTIPADGVTVFARLEWLIGSTWQHADYVYTESGTLTPATLSPSSGTLSTSQTFTWSNGVGPAKYQLLLGTTAAGSDNLYNSGATVNTMATATIPSDGVTVFATFKQLINGAWQTTKYTFTEPGTLTPATLTPLSGTLSTSQLFTWNNGVGPAEYELLLGTTSAGSSNVYSSGATTATQKTVTIPSNGVTVFATFKQLIDGVWQTTKYTFTEPGTLTPATLTPSSGTLSTSQLFTWNNGVGPAEYELLLGTTSAGSSNVYSSGATTATVTTVTIPSNGVTVFATFKQLIDGVWQTTKYTFTEP